MSEQGISEVRSLSLAALAWGVSQTFQPQLPPLRLAGSGVKGPPPLPADPGGCPLHSFCLLTLAYTTAASPTPALSLQQKKKCSQNVQLSCLKQDQEEHPKPICADLGHR
ncbi:hypothetical protein QTO34_011970 [Cnephaeus nilssonii]|uniref:Uncharacterized protein n=1 Tax=Cnephaeus nilssonii TaxID=3371016 RepID=A0AA40LDR5_CNENI|nr:hypothetical protein QTO34_011970 [Eptesicus nilssonii]